MPDPAMLTVRALKGSEAQILLAFIYARRSMHIQDIRTYTGLSVPAALRALSSLTAKGLLECQNILGATFWTPLESLP